MNGQIFQKLEYKLLKIVIQNRYGGERMRRTFPAMVFLALQLASIPICHGDDPQTDRQPVLQFRVIKYPDGQLKKQYWYFVDEKKNEVLHGPSLSWHKTGTIADQGYYSHRKRHGVQVYYDKHGKPWQLMEMKNGVPHGRHIEWYPNGTLRLEYRFREGKQWGSFKKWAPEGTISEQGVVKTP